MHLWGREHIALHKTPLFRTNCYSVTYMLSKCYLSDFGYGFAKKDTFATDL